MHCIPKSQGLLHSLQTWYRTCLLYRPCRSDLIGVALTHLNAWVDPVHAILRNICSNLQPWIPFQSPFKSPFKSLHFKIRNVLSSFVSLPQVHFCDTTDLKADSQVALLLKMVSHVSPSPVILEVLLIFDIFPAVFCMVAAFSWPASAATKHSQIETAQAVLDPA